MFDSKHAVQYQGSSFYLYFTIFYNIPSVYHNYIAPFGLPALIGNSYEKLQDDIEEIQKLEIFLCKNYVVVYKGR